MPIKEIGRRGFREYEDSRMLIHMAWAEMLACRAGMITKAAQRGGARTETMRPGYPALHKRAATPVSDFPKLVEGLAQIAREEGDESLVWAVGVDTRCNFEVHPKKRRTIVYKYPKQG